MAIKTAQPAPWNSVLPLTRKAARPAYRLTGETPREHPLQIQITGVLRIELCREGHVSRSGVCWFSIDMAHFAGVPGTRVARGICAGVPDLLVLWRGLAHWVEIKTETGSLTLDQRAVCVALLGASCRYAVARDADEVLACLDEWDIPRARRVRMAGTKERPALGSLGEEEG